MDPTEYLDFEDAVEFLKTTPSTLYKWLQAGKVPGHKLGRQWRFLRGELEQHISGHAPRIRLQKEAIHFADLLQTRAVETYAKRNSKTGEKEKFMELGVASLSEKLIWDAFDHGSRLIHIYPNRGKYEIGYRTESGLQNLTTIQEDLFVQMDQALKTLSSEIRGEESRRLYLQRADDEGIQVRYERVETVTGPRLTLRLWEPTHDVMKLEQITKDEQVLKDWRRWLGASHGLIIITGSNGSGKTTTFYSFLRELIGSQKVVFTIEDPVEMVVEGVNQVEVKGDRSEALERAFEQVYASDPDVICLGLNTPRGHDAKIYAMAAQAANTGHLVLLQMDAATCNDALDAFKKLVPVDLRTLVVGVSAQKLVREDGKLRAKYEVLSRPQKSE